MSYAACNIFFAFVAACASLSSKFIYMTEKNMYMHASGSIHDQDTTAYNCAFLCCIV